MTWAVFVVWAHDTYDEELFAPLYDDTVAVMDRRGFVRFRDFADELLDLYQNRAEGKTLADLYPALLDSLGQPK